MTLLKRQCTGLLLAKTMNVEKTKNEKDKSYFHETNEVIRQDG